MYTVQGFAQTLGFLIADALGRDASLVGVFVTIQASAAFVMTRFQRIRALSPPALAKTGVLLAAVAYSIRGASKRSPVCGTPPRCR